MLEGKDAVVDERGLGGGDYLLVGCVRASVADVSRPCLQTGSSPGSPRRPRARWSPQTGRGRRDRRLDRSVLDS